MNFYLKIAFILLSFMLFLNIYLHLNKRFQIADVPILSDISDALARGSLTQCKCGRTSCCEAGNANVSTFNTNAVGKCYGSGCNSNLN